MKRTVTHEIVTTDPATGNTEVSRHDFSEYKERSPHWDKYARAVMQPFVDLLTAKGYDVRVITK
jgi:hypothetical protein